MKYKITCTPTFCDGKFIAKQPLCAMCRIRKKDHCNWWTPHFVFKGAPPAWHQCKFCKCCATGATLSCVVPLANFLCCGGTSRYLQITYSWASQKLDKNHEHGRNLREFISSSSSMPILTTQAHRTTLPNHTNAAAWQDLIALSVFLIKNCLVGKHLDSSDSVGTCSRMNVIWYYTS